MFNGIFHIPEPQNEHVLGYAPGSRERAELKAKLEEMLSSPVEVPSIIGGREVANGDLVTMTAPHNHEQVLGTYHRAGPKEAEMAIDLSLIHISEPTRLGMISYAVFCLKKKKKKKNTKITK